MVVKYLDALAGAGKSYWIAERAIEVEQEGRNAFIAVPTIRLAEEEYRPKFENASVIYKIIHSDNTEGSAVKEIIEYLLAPQPGGQILVITHSALERLPQFMREQWTLFIDEIPQIYQLFEAELPKTHKVITDHLSLGENYASYQKLEITDRSALKEVADYARKDDGLSDQLADIALRLLSRHWSSYVDPVAYIELIEKKENRVTLTINSVLMPSVFDGFESVYIAGAHFKDSLLYLTWKKMGVPFAAAETNGLRFESHSGSGVAIYYFTRKKWSKTFAHIGKPEKVVRRLANFISSHIGERRFIYSQNKGDDLYPEDAEHQLIPYAPYGLNSYTNFDNVVLLAARNPRPAQSNFIKTTLGISNSCISQAIHKEVAYQNLMRSSLRDPINVNLKRIYVADFDTAEWLASEFGGATLEHIETHIPELAAKTPSKTVQSSAQRSKTLRDKKRKFEGIKFLQNPHVKSESSQGIATSSIYETNVTEFRGSCFAKRNSTLAAKNLYTGELEEFEEFLKDCFDGNIVEKKESNFLICPSLFNPDIGEKFKSLENVILANGVFLDFDGGDFGPEEFGAVFHDIRATTCTSFSATVEEIKFRAWIPTLKPMTKEDYATLIVAIEKRISESGFVWSKKRDKEQKVHMLDDTKINAASMFYAPCQRLNPPPDHLRHFRVWKGEGRCVLDPEKIVNNHHDLLDLEDDTMIQQENERVVLHSTAYKQQGIKWAIDIWRSVAGYKGEGHVNFNTLAFRLWKAGCDRDELKNILSDEAGFARNPSERRREIAHIVSSLTSSRSNNNTNKTMLCAY